MSAGVLLLARLTDPEQLVPTAELLEHSKNVQCWNAVDGHVDLVAKLTAPSAPLVDSLRGIDGMGDLDVFELSAESGTLLCDPAFDHAFVFMEVEPDKVGFVRDRLAAITDVVFSSTRTNEREMIAAVRGQSFQSVDRIVNEQIRPIDGVLRLKQDRVINLKQL